MPRKTEKSDNVKKFVPARGANIKTPIAKVSIHQMQVDDAMDQIKSLVEAACTEFTAISRARATVTLY